MFILAEVKDSERDVVHAHNASLLPVVSRHGAVVLDLCIDWELYL